jgi:hypothetical protein
VTTDSALNALQEELEPLERLVRLLAASLDPPKLISTERGPWFRYDAPDVRHFCLLKAARALSDFNASIELARKGYLQEICVLIRTLIECARHIEYVLEPYSSEEHREGAQRYLKEFFADNERSPTPDPRKFQVQQGKIHDALGKLLDQIAEQLREVDGRRPAAQLYKNTYRMMSNYIHARYPECMDLYGGRPGQFHVRGMSGTPKMGEALELLQSFRVALSNCFVMMVHGLNLRKIIDGDPVIASWYRDRFSSSE